MLDKPESTELEELYARKRADAKHALGALEEAWGSYERTLLAYQRGFEEYTEAKALSLKHQTLYDKYLERRSELQKIAADRARFFTLPESISKVLAPLLSQHIEFTVDLTFSKRPTAGGVGSRLLGLVRSQDKDVLYSYDVSYKFTTQARDDTAFVQALAPFLAERVNQELPRALGFGEGWVVDPGWTPLTSAVLLTHLPRLLGRVTTSTGGTITSNNPSESKSSLVQHEALQARLALSVARNIMLFVQDVLIPKFAQSIAVKHVRGVTPPVELGPAPGPAPEPPRLMPNSGRFWEEVPWEAHLERLRLEEERAPAQHMLLGYDPQSASPILLSRQLLHAHAHVVGATQTGKTSAALIPILTQLIRGSDETSAAGNLLGPPPPILIIDLKGDFALFNTARLEAKRRGQGFHYFTTHPEKDSHIFDIFGSLSSLVPTSADLGGFFAQAFDIFHGPGYGHGYYSKENREALVRGVDEARLQSGQAPSLASLGEALKTTASKKTGYDAREVQATFAPLVRPEIAVRLECREGTDPARIINMPKAVEKREVLYFWIPVLRSTAGLDIARLALYSFMHAVAERHYTRGERRAYAMIDEFQEVASFNIGRLLTFSAGVGLSLVMANQSVQNLKVGSTDIRDQVTANANLRLFFSIANSDDIEEIQRLSGEKTVWTQGRQRSQGHSRGVSETTTETNALGDSTGKSWGETLGQAWNHGSAKGGNLQGPTWSQTEQQGGSRGMSRGGSEEHSSSHSTARGTGESEGWDSRESMGITETIRPGLDANDILDASLVDRACIVHSKRDAGKTLLGGRPRPIRCLYSMDVEEYRARRATLWPQSLSPLLVESSEAARSSPSAARLPDQPSLCESEKQLNEHPKRRERGLILQAFYDKHVLRDVDLGSGDAEVREQDEQ